MQQDGECYDSCEHPVGSGINNNQNIPKEIVNYILNTSITYIILTRIANKMTKSTNNLNYQTTIIIWKSKVASQRSPTSSTSNNAMEEENKKTIKVSKYSK